MKCKYLLLLTVLWSATLAAVAQSGSIVGSWAHSAKPLQFCLIGNHSCSGFLL